MVYLRKLESEIRRLTCSKKVIGVGVDLVGVNFFRQHTPENYSHFYTRVFTRQEHLDCLKNTDAPQEFACRFAAKEAAVKALTSAEESGVAVPFVSVLLIATEVFGASAERQDDLIQHGMAALVSQHEPQRVVMGGREPVGSVFLHAATVTHPAQDLAGAIVIATLAPGTYG